MIPSGNNSIRFRRESGFTLIEIIMVIVLLGIVSFTAATLLYQGAKSFESLDVRKDLTEGATVAVERITRELRIVRCTTAGANLR